MGRRLAIIGASAGLLAAGIGCGEQHQAAPDRAVSPEARQGKTAAPAENPNVKRMAAHAGLVRSLLQKPAAEFSQKLHDYRGETDEADMPKIFIRTGVCAVVGYQKEGRTIAQYIRQPAVLYRNDKQRGIGETAMAGIDPSSGKLVLGQPRILDKHTGQVGEVQGAIREIDIYQSSQPPNLEWQPVELSATAAGGFMVHNSHGEEVMTVTGAAITHDTLSQVADDPITQYACFAGYGSVPPPTP